jgi:hypothetical protein
LRASTTAALSSATIVGGIPFGPIMPNHVGSAKDTKAALETFQYGCNEQYSFDLTDAGSSFNVRGADYVQYARLITRIPVEKIETRIVIT